MAAPRNATEVTQERLRELFSYDPEVGAFLRRKPTGRPVGGQDRDAYRTLAIDGRIYRQHRLAWLYVSGRWPVAQLDHVNGNRQDNRIANLRECSNSENRQNLGKYRKSTGLPTGVHFLKETARYRANLGHNRKLLYLGTFDTPELAHAAYLAAKSELHTFNPVPRRQHD